MTLDSKPPTVLIIDDAPNDIVWLWDRIRLRGYEIELVTNERAARERLAAAAAGQTKFVVALVDVMVAVDDINALIVGDDKALGASAESGIRLCHYARELGLTAAKLPLAGVTVRADDPKVRAALSELDVAVYPRLSLDSTHPITSFLDRYLPPRSERPGSAPAAGQ